MNRPIKIIITRPKKKTTSFEEILKKAGASDDDIIHVSSLLHDDDEKYEFAMEVERTNLGKAMKRLHTFPKLKYDFKTEKTDQFSIYRNTEYAKIEIEAESKHGTIIKGTYKCKRCGNDEVSMVTKQLRRADEPETHLFTCTKCSNTWRIG